MTKKTTYLARYWQNDGEWQDAGYDRSPIVVFEATDDGQAKKLALDYIRLNTYSGCEFSLTYLGRINLSLGDRVPFEDDGSKLHRIDGRKEREPLEKRVKAARMAPLRDAVIQLTTLSDSDE